MLMGFARIFLLLAMLSMALGCAALAQGGYSPHSQGVPSGDGAEMTRQSNGEMSSAYSSEAQDEVAERYGEDAGDAAASTPQTEIISNDPLGTVAVEPPSSGTHRSGSGPGLVEGASPEITDDSDEVGATERDEPQAADVATWPVYTDETHGFSISYPLFYVLETFAATALHESVPEPLLAVHFQDEEVAQSDTADLALPAFSIRVYENETQQPLEEWLSDAGLVKAWQYTEPYEGSHASGVSVLSRHYIAPGWFVYVAGDGIVYQLTPIGPTGELMLDTFQIRN